MVLVALLAEGVDRNRVVSPSVQTTAASPSSRRAWIEICCRCSWLALFSVALLAEGVDRNHTPVTVRPSRLRRPPRRGYR